jgi:hypothetical protein
MPLSLYMLRSCRVLSFTPELFKCMLLTGTRGRADGPYWELWDMSTFYSTVLRVLEYSSTRVVHAIWYFD